MLYTGKNIWSRLFSKLFGTSVSPEVIETLPSVIERPSPFGYKPSLQPVTDEPRYNRAVIDDYVRSHVVLPKDDALAQAHAEDLYKIYADYIAHLPPYRQILTLDGDRPSGDKRYLRLGESHVMRGKKGIRGVYDHYADSLNIKVQSEDHPEAPETYPTLLSIADIQATISHETAHQQDNQITKIVDFNEPWSMQSQCWAVVIQQEIASGNVGEYLQALLPETKIELHQPYYQDPTEAKAEFEMLFCLVYSKMGGDFKAASDAMGTAYPYMWPVFRDEYLAEASRVAAWLNPHIDLYAKPVGFDDVSHEALQKNLMTVIDRPSIGAQVVGHKAA